MLKHQTNNNYIYVIQEIRILLYHKHTISDKNIQNVLVEYILKEIAHHHIVLLQQVLSLIDGVNMIKLIIQDYHHKDHQLVIKLLIKDVEVDLYQEHLIMLKFMDWFNNHVFNIPHNQVLLKIVKRKHNHAKNSKLVIIVSPNSQKILNNKYSIMVQSSLLSQSIEIS